SIDCITPHSTKARVRLAPPCRAGAFRPRRMSRLKYTCGRPPPDAPRPIRWNAAAPAAVAYDGRLGGVRGLALDAAAASVQREGTPSPPPAAPPPGKGVA